MAAAEHAKSLAPITKNIVKTEELVGDIIPERVPRLMFNRHFLFIFYNVSVRCELSIYGWMSTI